MRKISKGHNSVKNVNGVSAHHLTVVYISIKFHENVFNGIKFIKRT